MHDPELWLCVLFIPLGVIYAFAILRELIFHQGRAVWISDAHLVFVPYGLPSSIKSYLHNIPLATIDHLLIGRMTVGGLLRPTGIIVHLKSGGRVDFPTHLLSESRETVLARLNNVLATRR